MLGIRHYLSYAIDLWQGPSDKFCCDLLIRIRNRKEEDQSDEAKDVQLIHRGGAFESDPLSAACWEIQLPFWMKQAEQQQFRHVCFAFENKKLSEPDPGEILQTLKNVLSDHKKQGEGGYLRRFTFILNNFDAYLNFQNALFAVFPDQECSL